MPTDDLQFQDFLAPEFQELLVGLMARDQDFLARARGIVKTKYFNAAVYKTITEALFTYWDEYRKLPTEEILVVAVSKHVFDATIQEAYIDATRKLFQIVEEDLDRQFIQSELTAFCQRAEAAGIVGQCWRNLQSFNIDKLALDVSNVQKLPVTFTDLGISVRKDWPVAIQADVNPSFPCGLRSIDLSLRGGAHGGELIALMAPAKRGKTVFLINVGAGLFQMGNLVVHYTLEIYQKECIQRYLGCLSHKPTNSIEKFTDDIIKQTSEYEMYTEGDVIIKEFPAKMATVEMIDAHMSMIQAKYGKTPIPVIDYADLLKGPSGMEEWRELSEIYVQLRNLGRRYEVPVFTASQTNASGFNAERLGAEHQSGSTRKGFAVDAMFGMEQNAIDYSVNRFRIVPFLNRNERKDLVSYWRGDYECSWIEEITESEYNELVTDVSIRQQISRRRTSNDNQIVRSTVRPLPSSVRDVPVAMRSMSQRES